MNESLLNALMELIALFARVNKTRFIDNAHTLLKTYLDQTVSIKNSRLHIRRFFEYFEMYANSGQISYTDEPSLRKSISEIVKKINMEMNEEERIVLFLSFLELIKLDKKVETEELLFVEILSIELHISRNDYKNSLIFILCDNAEINEEENPEFILVTKNRANNLDELEGSWIEQNRPQDKEKKLLIIKENLEGDILVLRLQGTKYLAGRYFGNHSLYLNNRRILPRGFFLIGQFDQIKIGNIEQLTYQEIYTGFKSNLQHTSLKFIGENVSTLSKKEKKGFAPFNFYEELGNLVIILCNDSTESKNLTLLLSGQLALTTGKICLNGYNIYTEKYRVHKMIGLVPRENLFDENISIYNNIWFSARLSFPGYSNQKIAKLVDKTIISLGLKFISHVPIKNIKSALSYDYLKILINTGMEIIRDPFILILDLPLDKLNSSNAEDFCEIIKAEANNGKLIFLTSINPSSCVLKRTDRMWIFDSGGFIIYRGQASNALTFFKNATNSIISNSEICPFCGNINSEQLYRLIHAKIIDNHGKTTLSRKTLPEEWYKIYKKNIEGKETRTESRKVIPSFSSSIPDVNLQFLAYLKKSVSSFLSNPFKPLIILVSGLALTFLISGLLRYDWSSKFSFSRHEFLPLLFFLNTAICFIIGILIGLQLTTKDKLHIAYDHFKNYSFFSYLNVKYILLTFLTLIFSVIFTFITDFVSGIDGLLLLNWLIYYTLTFIGGCVGLLFGYISLQIRKAMVITFLLFCINILFSGYILPYNSLPKQLASERYVPAFAEVFPSRWAYEALIVQQVKDNSYQKNLFKVEQNISDISFKTNILVPKLQEGVIKWQNQAENAPKLSFFYKELNAINKRYPDIFPFEFQEELNKRTIKGEVLSELEDYIQYVQFQLYEKLKQNIALRNEMRQNLKDSIGAENYQDLMNQNYNKNLFNYVSAKKSGGNYLESGEEIIQTDEPIFRLPENNFGRAHFFAPQKLMNGYYYDTTYFNLFVMWLQIFLIYTLTLIFRKKSIT